MTSKLFDENKDAGEGDQPEPGSESAPPTDKKPAKTAQSKSKAGSTGRGKATRAEGKTEAATPKRGAKAADDPLPKIEIRVTKRGELKVVATFAGTAAEISRQGARLRKTTPGAAEKEAIQRIFDADKTLVARYKRLREQELARFDKRFLDGDIGDEAADEVAIEAAPS